MLRIRLLCAVALSCIAAGSAHAQARPGGNGRAWMEAGLGASGLRGRCPGCVGGEGGGGFSASLSGGYTIPYGLGLAVVGRGFAAFDLAGDSRRSSYLVALAQYSPPAASLLTLNAGAGWTRFQPDATFTPRSEGAVLAGGLALRLPRRSPRRSSLAPSRASPPRRSSRTSVPSPPTASRAAPPARAARIPPSAGSSAASARSGSPPAIPTAPTSSASPSSARPPPSSRA